MASYYSTQYQAAYRDVPNTKINYGDFNGEIKHIYATWTPPAVMALNEFAYLAKIPKGARIMKFVMQIPDQGTVGAFSVGWAASAELDSAGTAVEAASIAGFLTTQAVTADVVSNLPVAGSTLSPAGIFKLFAAECDVTVKATTATDVGAGTVYLHIEYVTP